MSATEVEQKIDALGAANARQDEARIAAIVEMRRLERLLGEALDGRVIYYAPEHKGFRGWNLRGAPHHGPGEDGWRLFLSHRGLLVLARVTAADGLVTVPAEDTDLVAEDLERLLQVLVGALTMAAAGRDATHATQMRALARRCARILDGHRAADEKLERLWQALGETELGGPARYLADLIRDAIGGAP